MYLDLTPYVGSLEVGFISDDEIINRPNVFMLRASGLDETSQKHVEAINGASYSQLKEGEIVK